MQIKTKEYRVDLKDFCLLTIRAIEDGTLPDDDRSLKSAAQEVLNARTKLIDGCYGRGKYADHGGVSVFLPGRDLRNAEYEARVRCVPGKIAEMTMPQRFNDVNANKESRAQFTLGIATDVMATRLAWFFGVKDVGKELSALETAASDFSKGTTDEQRREAFTRVHKAALALEATPAFKKIRATNLEILKEHVANVYRIQSVDSDDKGWTRFRDSLKPAGVKDK